MNLVLANIDFQCHTTDEGEQLQRGLEIAGWKLAGFGYDDGCVHVPTLLDRHRPDIVLVQAREDWDAASSGTFDKRVSFTGVDSLATYPAFKVHVVKDCPGRFDRRKAWVEEIKADALLTYYHNDAVVPLSPWIADYPHIRHRHTIDGEVVKSLEFTSERRRAVVSGSMNRPVYPMRTLVQDHADRLGVDLIKHPGYSNRGTHSGDYLRTLSRYKVSIACSSRFGFCLRKLLESAAAGCKVVTDLPEFDTLPWLDDALIRVPQGAGIDRIRAAIDIAESQWSPALADSLRARAIEHYDYKASGWYLSEAIIKAAGAIA